MGTKLISLGGSIEDSQLKYTAIGRAILYKNKTPKYEVRIRSWAKSFQGEHLDNLVEAEIAEALREGLLRGADIDSVNYYRGLAAGILRVQERVKSLASDFIKTNTDQDD
jgi:hypothetical protein